MRSEEGAGVVVVVFAASKAPGMGLEMRGLEGAAMPLERVAGDRHSQACPAHGACMGSDPFPPRVLSLTGSPGELAH